MLTLPEVHALRDVYIDNYAQTFPTPYASIPSDITHKNIKR
jgi:hypothetical protein